MKYTHNKPIINNQEKFIRAKKSLGQNFLNSTALAKDIVRAGVITKNDTVLEIGPGKGLLTKELLAHGARVVAFEKDDRLKTYLEEKFKEEIESKKFLLIPDDIFHLKQHNISLPKKFKVVANIPYYITGKLIPFLFEQDPLPETIVLLVQHEVAQRIAQNKKESILSLSVKVFSSPKIVKKVPARYFTPKPKVHSAVLQLSHISKNNFKDVDEKTFFSLVKRGFASRRKLLKNNIRFDEKVWHTCDIAEGARAEDVPLKKWLCLAKHYE